MMERLAAEPRLELDQAVLKAFWPGGAKAGGPRAGGPVAAAVRKLETEHPAAAAIKRGLFCRSFDSPCKDGWPGATGLQIRRIRHPSLRRNLSIWRPAMEHQDQAFDLEKSQGIEQDGFREVADCPCSICRQSGPHGVIKDERT